MGMADAFSSSRADFSAMTVKGRLGLTACSTPHTCMSTSRVRSLAACSGQRETTSSGFEMVVDRPYLTVIVDERSGAILFLAAIRDPRG
jgi:serine protease inhibitor